MKSSIDQLKLLGFSEKEALIYLATLELGEAPASEIAKKARLKRTTVYNLIPELVEKGHVEVTSKRGVKHYFIDDVRNIKKRAEEQIELIDEILPELKAIHNVIPQKPKITMHEGLGGFKAIYDNFLENVPPGGCILAYAGTEDFFRFVPKKLYESYIQKRIDAKIRVKIITSPSPLGESLLRTEKQALREVKMLASDKFKFSGETIIYENKIAVISYQENFLGIVIESNHIAKMHREVFETLWEKI